MFLLLVTLISLVLAVIMGAIAWRVSQEERRRSEARVARLAAEIQASSVEPEDPAPYRPDIGFRLIESRETEADFERGSEPLHTAGGAHSAPAWERSLAEPRVSAGSNMFAEASTAHTSTRLATVAVIGVIVFGSAATVAVVLGRGASQDASTRSVTRDTAGAVSQTATPNPRAAAPLELVALGHERDGDRLTVRGVVRNPSDGAEVDHVTAVVFLFSREGGFVGSGRAAIEAASLVPGAESGFIVTMTVSDVTRYRVSFRTEDRVVPHVDRRDQPQAKE
jgi:hypothetical protein